ncbi:hypothetical protein [Massilia sp. DD77]
MLTIAQSSPVAVSASRAAFSMLAASFAMLASLPWTLCVIVDQ